MNLHDLKPRPGATHRIKRLGIGESSGHGKTSGRGHKGQKARSGGHIRPGFEGGQMPLIRRMPKRGFNNTEFKTYLAPVNLETLNMFKDGDKVDEALLRAKRLVTGTWHGVKILGNGKLTRKLTIVATAASKTAVEKISQAGGTLELVKKPTAKQ